MARILFALALCSLNIGCSSPDEPQVEVELATELVEEAPESPMPASEIAERRKLALERAPEDVEAIVERRDRLRKQMSEQHDEPLPADKPDVRQQGAVPWWRDPNFHEGLGLSEQQKLALEDAATTVLGERERLSRQMPEVQRDLAAALNEENDELVANARLRRNELHRQLESVDQEWQDAMRLLLDQEQLEQLEAQQPQWRRWGRRGHW